ncbi:MAG: formate C-acetyltransferase [Deltaproteobacteria bacterium]|nr:formate C-acetyltransferase [Deltaproteobacteria bacterium]
MSSKRIQKMMEGLRVEKYPMCIEKVRLITESYRQTEGEPEILRRAKAIAHTLSNITIFIRDGELIVGNGASRYMGVEIEFNYGPWPKAEIAALKSEGWLISDSDLKELELMNEYWRKKSLVIRMGRSFDENRLWPFMQSGIVYAPWKSKEEGSGGGYAESGMGLGPGFYNIVVDYEKALKRGLGTIITEAEKELETLRFLTPGSIERGHFLNAVIISLKSVIGFARRFSALAGRMALEERDQERKKEIERIEEICKRVPGEPAQNFREAVQSFWFCYLMMCPSPTAGIGRMDQFLYPFYRKDIAKGSITDEEVLEYLQSLRIKDMEINRISGMANRQKNAGKAKWHNCTIGGQTADGADASNELSYLILEAAKRCPTPHHTITLRVHKGTPETLMLKAIELVKTGIGMPAFIGDKSYIGYFLHHGIPLKEARNYAMAGCIDAALPGKSCMMAVSMFIVPMVLEITLNNGIFPKTGLQLGPKTGDPDTFTTFDELMIAFKKQFTYFLEFNAEYNNIWVQAHIDGFPDPIRTALMDDPIRIGRNIAERPYFFNNQCVLNVVGMINAVDSLAAMKKLVFDEKRWSMKELRTALAANWAGHEEIRKACVAAPKFGNDSDYADSIAAELYRHLSESSATFGTILGGTQKPSGISISTQGPGGALTGATPDGRFAGEYLADGAVSPVQGMDTNGPTAVIKSAAKIDHTPMQATLLNMKFHPSALADEEDMQKLAVLIKTYFELGGKHVQFNIVDRETLIAARNDPEKYKDLIVRVAGYSAYFVNLTPAIQLEIIARSELQMN